MILLYKFLRIKRYFRWYNKGRGEEQDDIRRCNYPNYCKIVVITRSNFA